MRKRSIKVNGGGFKPFVIAYFSILIFMSACTHKKIEPIIPWQSMVDSLSSLTQSLKFDIPRTEEDDSEKKARFNILRYFEVLDHLKLDAGYSLDYIYFRDDIAGFPILYARKLDESPFQNMKEFTEKRGRPSSDEFWARVYGKSSPGLNNFLYGYMNRIHIDDTPMGYFQYIVLRLMGSQYYLFWHGQYNDQRIICDYPGLEAILADLAKPGSVQNPLPMNIVNKAAMLAYEPLIEFQEESVMVNVIVFSSWGGFIQKSFLISRRFPHKVLKETNTVLIAYDCGWSF